ncbi:MAG: tetratricopeptide repeat protein [Spirochaetia bacterium]|jgi:tetratricopeptide (TPR) repeat protein
MILNYDHYRTGQRKRRARTVLIPVLVGVAILLVAAVIIFHIPARLFGPSLAHQPPGKLPDLFKAEKYDDVIAAANATLRGDPLNTVALSYKGFASFYRAVAQNTTEERMPFLDQAIVSLRRARLVGTPFAGETDYVLGKAYLNKGKYYYDLAISSMESSLAKGYVQKDSHEYIGQAYTQLGDYEKGLDHFLTALKTDSGDLLLLTIGQTYYQMKRTSDAVDYLLRTLNKTEDKDIEERARFLLGGIYLDTGELFKAEEQFTAIVRIDARSADAHYDLGEVYAKMNDPVKARAEWRNALIIDPSHYGAKLRYYSGKR